MKRKIDYFRIKRTITKKIEGENQGESVYDSNELQKQIFTSFF